jgi:hypothetical protein
MALASKTDASAILLKGDPPREESLADGAITPGDLLERSSATEVIVHQTAAGNAQRFFAMPNPWKLPAGAAQFADYADAETVLFIAAQRGDHVRANLAVSQTITVGMALESAGDGTLQEAAADAATDAAQREAIVGYAREAVTTTAAEDVIVIEVA